MRYIEFGQVEKIKDLMITFPLSSEKNFIALHCGMVFKSEKEFFNSQLSTEFSTDIYELLELNVLEIERP